MSQIPTLKPSKPPIRLPTLLPEMKHTAPIIITDTVYMPDTVVAHRMVIVCTGSAAPGPAACTQGWMGHYVGTVWLPNHLSLAGVSSGNRAHKHTYRERNFI